MTVQDPLAPLQMIIPWIDVVRILAAVAGGTYSLGAVLTLWIYVRTKRPRIHRVLLGVGSAWVSAVLTFLLWTFPAVFTITGAGICGAGFFVELLGLSAMIARDFEWPRWDADKG